MIRKVIWPAVLAFNQLFCRLSVVTLVIRAALKSLDVGDIFGSARCPWLPVSCHRVGTDDKEFNLRA